MSYLKLKDKPKSQIQHARRRKQPAGSDAFFHSIIIKLHDSYSPGKTVDTPKKKKTAHRFQRQSTPLCTPGVGVNPLSTNFEDYLHPSTRQGIKKLKSDEISKG